MARLVSFSYAMCVCVMLLSFDLSVYGQLGAESPRVRTQQGIVEGLDRSGVKMFLGIPFAAAPVGDLRWREPQPPPSREGVLRTVAFGPRPMQQPVYGDMNFRSDTISEDCLYLNIWTPAVTGEENLPVLVYFYGGGLIAGSGCEPRYEGESIARRGVVSITVNYRLGIFGFFAHPALTAESPHASSGNYGFMDQNAALKWIKSNIRAFGGNPEAITIAGESAGSRSVSAQMCSPLSKGLFARAIGSSGSLLRSRCQSLAEVEQQGLATANSLGAHTLDELRALPVGKLLAINNTFRGGAVDGYFFPEPPITVFAKGDQAHVPMLVGWNSLEAGPGNIFGGKEPTLANLREKAEPIFGDKTERALAMYGATDEKGVVAAATDLASDMFVAFGTWLWSDTHARTGGGQPVYRYMYYHPRPWTMNDVSKQRAAGAVHSADIEYVMGNLPTNRVFDWQPDDYMVSEVFQSYYVNFIKTGDPNGLGLPGWSPVNGRHVAPVLQIGVKTYQKQDPQLEEKYKFLIEAFDVFD